MTRAFFRIAGFLVTFFTPAAYVAFGQQYPFLPVQGSPRGITTLFQDSKSRLWLGGDQPALFDGVRFFPLRDYGFPAAAVFQFAEDGQGTIWVAAESGLYRFAGGRIQEIGKAEVTSIAIASPDLIFATVGPLGKGLPPAPTLARIQRKQGKWKIEMIPQIPLHGPVTLDRGSLLYARYEGGWYGLPMEELARWHPGIQLKPESHSIPGYDGFYAGAARVIRDQAGCVWVGAGGIMFTCDGKTWSDELQSADSTAGFSEASDGQIVVTNGNLLTIGRPGSFRIATTANGLPPVLSAIQARDGTVWIGIPQGLVRFASPFHMEYWTTRDGVEAPWSIERNGTDIYAGLDRHVGVLEKNRQHWQELDSFPDIGQVTNLRTTKDGNILAALNPGGVALIRRDGTILARTSEPGFYGLRLAILPDNETWFGGLTLGRLERAGSVLKLVNHFLETQPAGNVVGLQYEDHTRRLWACYNGGIVVRYEDGTWREFTTKDGLLTNPCWTLAALPNGDLLYGYMNTPAFGLVHPDSRDHLTVRQFRQSDEISDPESVNLGLDHRGWIWRGGNHGMSVADVAQAETGRWLYLDQSDGLSGESVNTGSFFPDTDGSVWFGDDLTIVHYNPPADLLDPRSAPEVFLSSWSWDGAKPKIAEAVDGVPYGRNVVAHIGSLQFDRRNALRVRYRILPEQADWRTSASLNIPLGSVATGTHTLEVQGRVFNGPWSPLLKRSVTVLVPVWRSWTFVLAYIVALAGASFAGALWYRQHKEDEEIILPDVSKQRLLALLPEVGELTGTVLDGRFEVGGLMARGGFANVLEGYDKLERRRCAIKVFRSEVDKDWIRRSFQQEVAALQKVRHPNVVCIYAAGSVPSGSPYLVMEFLDGTRLRDALEPGPFAPERAARILLQLGSALDAIHAQGVCHRDVTPENVIIRYEGSSAEQAILIDFSIAIVKDANEALHGLSRAAGAFDYMAPEQAIGEGLPASDIYSLARIAIEMLTGKKVRILLPSAGLNLPDQVRTLLKGLDVPLSDASIEMLASAQEFDPRKRPSVANEFAGRIAKDLESAARP